MQVEWRRIELACSGIHEVSSLGQVRSMTKAGWVMKKPSIQSGYHTYNFWAGKTVRKMAHQLVAIAFIGPPPEGKRSINHKDGNKLNNHPSNLEWCSDSENASHAWETGLCKPQKLTPEDVIEILTCGGLDTPTAKRFGVSQVMVTKIRAGKVWRKITAPFLEGKRNQP